MTFLNSFAQSFWLPEPGLTENNLPDQYSRVFIVTGGYAGIGLLSYELSRILYSRNGTVYVAGRCKEKADRAIKAIRSINPESKGRLEFLQVDLADLTTIKKAADEFMSKESRLDVLTNNAGVMKPPAGSTSAQGRELQMCTNVLGPFLFTKCLTPLILRTASESPNGTTRVTWAGSMVVDVLAPKPDGITFDSTDTPIVHRNNAINYSVSKVANLMLASEFAKRFPFNESNIITNAWNPGNLHSEIHRHNSKILLLFLSWMMYPTTNGAYTELWAGWSMEAGKEENNARYIWPWGRFGKIREDINVALKGVPDGGTGKAAKLWEWCERETKPYA
ncbi:hypothetical protein BDV97DRAFT_389916 [Delphinella strobiligena]|nr:hypothetical protein BDV97DRAFT_389916 [Delphinella strobiligena]